MVKPLRVTEMANHLMYLMKLSPNSFLITCLRMTGALNHYSKVKREKSYSISNLGKTFFYSSVNLFKKNPYSKALTLLSHLWKVSVLLSADLREGRTFMVTYEFFHCFAAN